MGRVGGRADSCDFYLTTMNGITLEQEPLFKMVEYVSCSLDYVARPELTSVGKLLRGMAEFGALESKS